MQPDDILFVPEVDIFIGPQEMPEVIKVGYEGIVTYAGQVVAGGDCVSDIDRRISLGIGTRNKYTHWFRNR
jgi:hypothetical protein